MKAILDTSATLSLGHAMQCARDALEITNTVDNVLPNEGLDVASEFLTEILDELSKLSGENWKTTDWIRRTPYKVLIQNTEKERQLETT